MKISDNILKNIKIPLKRWWPTTLTLLVVLYATLWPDPVGADNVMLFPCADKLIHAIMMGGLSSAILFDYRRSGKKITTDTCLIVSLIMIIFSLLDETGQYVMGLGRSFELLDLAADTGGVILGIILSRPVINKIFEK